MSEYQYYEFCSISSPLAPEAKKEMSALSSRAGVGTHGASYVYNYGDFPGDPKKLLLKYFDVFFYISNWGMVQLMFKYPRREVDIKKLQTLSIKHVISCEQHDQYVLLDIDISPEEGGGWVEGEGWLSKLLPLYDEIKAGNYQLLHLASAIGRGFLDDGQNNEPNLLLDKELSLSKAQSAFLDCVNTN